MSPEIETQLVTSLFFMTWVEKIKKNSVFISDAVAASAVTAAAMFIEYTSDNYVLLGVYFILRK